MCCSVNVSVCLVCCVFDSVCQTIRNVFSVGGGALLDRPLWSSKECVCCACDPNEHLSVPSICFVCVLYVGSYLFI